MKDLPRVALIFKSGSKSLLKDMLNSRNPLKTDKTTNKASAPTIIPNDAMPVIILIALFLLLLIRYRRAMNKGKFNLRPFPFVEQFAVYNRIFLSSKRIVDFFNIV